MPTYINNSTEDIYQNDPNHTPIRVAAGATFTTAYYIPNLPDYFEKTLDTPLVQPFKLLATIATISESPIDVTEWDTIVIHNDSNGIVQVAANGDINNAMVILAGAKEVWDDTLDIIGTVAVTANAGTTGAIYIWGKTTAKSVYVSRMLSTINNLI